MISSQSQGCLAVQRVLLVTSIPPCPTSPQKPLYRILNWTLSSALALSAFWIVCEVVFHLIVRRKCEYSSCQPQIWMLHSVSKDHRHIQLPTYTATKACACPFWWIQQTALGLYFSLIMLIMSIKQKYPSAHGFQLKWVCRPYQSWWYRTPWVTCHQKWWRVIHYRQTNWYRQCSISVIYSALQIQCLMLSFSKTSSGRRQRL